VKSLTIKDKKYCGWH